ncbi:hypothetical protein DFH09DRAFT_1355787 [Mycena vulgaris]|nr:hypothetical protein DFH09DRAFT_1355787 [Mycena vulgaris]
MLFNAAVLPLLALTGSAVAAPHRRPKVGAVGTTVIATGPNAKATAISTNGGPAKAVAFGRRQIDIGDILSSLEAQAGQALATGVAGTEQAGANGEGFTFSTSFATTVTAAGADATDAAGDATGDDAAAAVQSAAQGAAAGTTVIATGANAQATAVSTNGGPAQAVAIGGRNVLFARE